MSCECPSQTHRARSRITSSVWNHRIRLSEEQQAIVESRQAALWLRGGLAMPACDILDLAAVLFSDIEPYLVERVTICVSGMGLSSSQLHVKIQTGILETMQKRAGRPVKARPASASFNVDEPILTACILQVAAHVKLPSHGPCRRSANLCIGPLGFWNIAAADMGGAWNVDCSGFASS